MNTPPRPAAAKSIIDRHALLHQILKYAASPSRRLIDVNPAIETELPKKRRPAPKGLHLAEWQALSAAIAQIDPDGMDLADFLLASGWRWSEAIALDGYAVEDYGARMWVTMRQVGRRNARNQVEIVEDGKGEGSLRRTEMGEAMAATIRRRVATQPPGGLVFTTRTGRQWHYSNFRRDVWDPAVKVANLARKPTPHHLRHTAVFWGSMSGANISELSARIGHRQISTTIDVYGGSIGDIQPDALAKVEALRLMGRDPSAVRGRLDP